MTVKERLKEYLTSKRIRINHFEQSIGAANGFVNNIRMSISPEKLESITKEYKDLNITWLLTGEGEMISMKGKDLSESAVAKSDERIPFYDDVATYGGNIVSEPNSSYAPTEYIDKGTWFGKTKVTAAIRHYGDSMMEYPNGCILALKEITDFSNVVWGRNYVIETDEIRVTKRVQSSSSPEHIVAYSTNVETYPDGRQIHEPFEISRMKIRKVFLVIGRVVKENGIGSLVNI